MLEGNFTQFYNDEIIINTKTHFYTDEKLFELFCTENAFEKGNGSCCKSSLLNNLEVLRTF